jgi:hypothetical protein
MTHENTLIIQSFLFNTLSEVGKIELTNNKLNFTNPNNNIELSISSINGVTLTDLQCLIYSIAK